MTTCLIPAAQVREELKEKARQQNKELYERAISAETQKEIKRKFLNGERMVEVINNENIIPDKTDDAKYCSELRFSSFALTKEFYKKAGYTVYIIKRESQTFFGDRISGLHVML